jgi:hypothetical protein
VGNLDSAAAAAKYKRGEFADAFSAKPFYNGEFIVKKKK